MHHTPPEKDPPVTLASRTQAQHTPYRRTQRTMQLCFLQAATLATTLRMTAEKPATDADGVRRSTRPSASAGHLFDRLIRVAADAGSAGSIPTNLGVPGSPESPAASDTSEDPAAAQTPRHGKGASRGRARRNIPRPRTRATPIAPPNAEGLFWRIRNKIDDKDQGHNSQEKDPLTAMISDYRQGKGLEAPKSLGLSKKVAPIKKAAPNNHTELDTPPDELDEPSSEADTEDTTDIDEVVDDGFLARYRKQGGGSGVIKSMPPESKAFDAIGRVLATGNATPDEAFEEALVDEKEAKQSKTRPYITKTQEPSDEIVGLEDSETESEPDQQTPFKALFDGNAVGDAKKAFFRGADKHKDGKKAARRGAEKNTVVEEATEEKEDTAPISKTDLSLQSILESVSKKPAGDATSEVLVEDSDTQTMPQEVPVRKKKTKKKNKSLPAFLLSPADNGSTDCRACRGSGICRCRVCHGDGWIRPPVGTISEEMKMVWSRPDLVLNLEGAAQCPFCNGVGRNLCPDCQGSGNANRKGFDERDEYARVFRKYQVTGADDML